mmetsp:Transcript_33754/g.106655  ORF Transcript_33754/g.106655 Transcript_33754/m.106655 type:complete len:150 (-) Transcript_33754:55-504(-)
MRDSAKCVACLEEMVRNDAAEQDKINKEADVYRTIGGMASMTADLDRKAAQLTANMRANAENIAFLKSDMKGVVDSVAQLRTYLDDRCPTVTNDGLAKCMSALRMAASSVSRFDERFPVDNAMIGSLESTVSTLLDSAEPAKKVSTATW